MDHSTIEAFADTFAKAPRLAEMEVRSAAHGVLRFRRSLASAEKKPKPAAKPPTPASASDAVPAAAVTEIGTNTVVTSTLVGIFRASRKAPVSVGSLITAGQTIGMIEVMRLSDEVTAPVAGEIAAIFVLDGQPVEYGQALFEIEPADDEGEEADA